MDIFFLAQVYYVRHKDIFNILGSIVLRPTGLGPIRSCPVRSKLNKNKRQVVILQKFAPCAYKNLKLALVVVQHPACGIRFALVPKNSANRKAIQRRDLCIVVVRRYPEELPWGKLVRGYAEIPWNGWNILAFGFSFSDFGVEFGYLFLVLAKSLFVIVAG